MNHLLIVLLAAGASAQQPSALPTSPKGCTRMMSQQWSDAYRAARKAKQPFDRKAADAAQQALGEKCAAQFDVAAIAVSQLVDLAELYADVWRLDDVDR